MKHKMSATTVHRLQRNASLVLRALVVLLVSLAATNAARAAQTGGKKSPQRMEAKTEKTAAPAQRLFATPEEAMEALTAAAKAKDKAALDAIYGPGREKLDSGDAVEDSNDLARFAERIEKTASLSKVDDSKFTLLVGEDNWAFPIPIVKQGDKWRFDTQAGAEELLNRRIGENELSAILTCRAYVLAQWEYFTEGDHDKDGIAEYAQKFISTPGHHDGLYWETAEGEKTSPLGALVGQARAEGYSAGRGQTPAGGDSPEKSGAAAQTPRVPYHGYFFRILTRQGSHAPGGKFGYIINGNMIAGYALIAYPDKWGNSGVMTFIVNNQGRVYQKNLGARTAQVAAAITEYDPDPSWKPVKEQ
jgi:DUF2950 family protein